ncbi:hypothetical protein CBR_g49651 [Chara braunii]|uniref:Uncharacterized protein n=1 Tax=Chara braunii TaxID=69332 RepID=A0A388M5I2_CHABU|nr:hypothetical protein CBR_g49651 [Chara braunii]|eukprot:GBG89800.1 hypothetical protein CBR_g49651 [Chara braunii]
MPEDGGAGRFLTLEDLIAALDRHERTPSNVLKVETFDFDGERVSEWLDLVEQAMVGLSDEVKFQRIMRYVLHRHHQEVQKVVDAAHGIWARFRENMLRKYRLGDGLLTISDLEGMNKDDFTTIGVFVQEFKKKARKVHGISEERQCAIFLELLTGSEAPELTNRGGGSAKLTWATINRGVEDGSLDQVEQDQMRLQRRKRKERDAAALGTPGVKRIVTYVLAALGYGQDAEAQRKAVAVVQGRGKEVGDEGAGQEDYGGEETGSDFLKAAMQRGGRGTRPRQRPLGASGGEERHGPFRREPTPVFDDDNIEFFLDAYREHAAQRGWDLSERVRHLRGVGRFEEPVAQIREEALTWSEVEARMQRLRVLPLGNDGLPIRLEEGNVEKFIPAYEQYMSDQGVPRDEWVQTLLIWTRGAECALARQIRGRARDWEDCRAQWRVAFRRLEP